MPALPYGVIIMWSGSVANIPAGYVLCDGNNGTPDLREDFIVGAGDTYNPGDYGGSTVHDHNFTGDGHAHGWTAGNVLNSGAYWTASTTIEVATGTSDPSSSMPPYYALVYIMKT